MAETLGLGRSYLAADHILDQTDLAEGEGRSHHIVQVEDSFVVEMETRRDLEEVPKGLCSKAQDETSSIVANVS